MVAADLLKRTPMQLSGKSILITGASGIAAAGALRAAAEGARVFIISLLEEECRALAGRVADAGASVGWAKADLTDESEADRAFTEAAGHLEGLDGLLAVAGGSGRAHGDGPTHEIPLDGWARTMAMNTHPFFLATRNAIGQMGKGGGSIVIVSSVLAASPAPAHFATHAYAAAKGAANAFVTTAAAYYAGQAIRVNAIAPGLVRTPMSERAGSDPVTMEYAARKQPLAGGFVEPEEIASLASFLLSDEAAMITGQVIAVDGGWSVTGA
jgi:NAD(P)-dependent dehydrogenase (short-subunit alcohol dehydrogenase family)